MRATLLATTVVFMQLACSVAAAGDFRVGAKVYAGNDKTPIVETLTVFNDVMAYDFMLTGSKEVTVYDRLGNRIVVLDPSRKVQTIYLLTELNAQIQKMKELHANGVNKALFDPDFTIRYNETEGSITAKGAQVEYWARGSTPSDPVNASTYLEFTDWAARLNAVAKGGLPPFSRMVLNAELKKHNLMPAEIDVTIKHPESRGAIIHLSSQQETQWRLLEADKDRIAEVSRQMKEFQYVTPIAYRAGDK